VTRVTLLTDFGTADGYAAAMAGVLATAAPGANLDAASHDIPPGDVFAAALALSRYWSLYPEGTIHLVVVDPGVGTARRAVAATADGRHFVAPDNGVLTWVLRAAARVRLVEIDAPELTEHAAATFHGRDLFAPVAARLATGVPLEELGPPVHDPVLLAVPEPERSGSRILAEVIQVDRFGNLITNVPGGWAPDGRVAVEEVDVGLVRGTYADVAAGELVAVVGSLGLLEVSVRDGSAADRLGAGRGARVIVSV
jgi:S-adenosylmethionine hydrolase